MWIVDRLEGEYVICEKEDGSLCSVPLNLFDGTVREGDCLRESRGRFSADAAATQDRREQMKRRFSHLWKRNTPPKQ